MYFVEIKEILIWHVRILIILKKKDYFKNIVQSKIM